MKHTRNTGSEKKKKRKVGSTTTHGYDVTSFAQSSEATPVSRSVCECVGVKDSSMNDLLAKLKPVKMFVDICLVELLPLK